MKTIPLSCRIVCGLILLALPLFAQNFEATDVPLQTLTPADPIPIVRQSVPVQTGPSYLFQRPGTLEPRKSHSEDPHDFNVSPILQISRWKMAVGSEDFLARNLTLLSATYRETAGIALPGKCEELSLSVARRIGLDSAIILEIVASEISANPSCACEIVKAAIRTTEEDVSLILAIVETAITNAPEQLRLISQCAIAASPESLTAVQALLAKLDPNAGESGDSAKSAKGAKNTVDAIALASPEKAKSNPLDLPPLHIVSPPPILPPLITNVNP
jgi:hypothetical protein